MRPRHGAEVETVGVLAVPALAIALIVSETVLHADDDPAFVSADEIRVRPPESSSP
jgi:hypothetical protein